MRVQILLVTAGALLAAAPIAASKPGGAANARPAKLSPVLVRETFTPLPCSGKPGRRTTLQQEGCAEHRILSSDARINALSRAIFPVLPGDRARRRFNSAQRAWLGYRRVDCLSMADPVAGGSEVAVVVASCTADRNTARVKELKAFRDELNRTG